MKKNHLILGLCVLWPLMSCGNNQPKILKQEILDSISDNNITYHSDYNIYYYENGKPEEKNSWQRFDVIAKFVPDRYQMSAYIYGSDTIASYANLSKDSEGYVVNKEINILNEVETKRVYDGEGKAFLWDESVYSNYFSQLNAADFALNENKTAYSYKGDLNGEAMNILHAAIPVSTFNLEKVELFVENKEITKVVFQEAEADDVIDGYMYGRSLTITFSDIGTTVIDDISPYPVSVANDDLESALTEMKTLHNYQIKIDAIIGETELPLSKTIITETDVLKEEYDGSNTSFSGYHTVDNQLYTFSTVNEYLYGKSSPLSSFHDRLPSFNFSKDIFTYEGNTSDGLKTYTTSSSMKAVLNFIDFENQHSEDYYPSEGPIRIYVADKHLVKIEFPSYLFINSEAVVATLRLSYQDFGTATIAETVWDSFVTELPIGDAGWNSPMMTFEFSFSDDEEDKMMVSVEDILQATLGVEHGVPYFLPTEYVYMEFYGNKSLEDACVYFGFIAEEVFNEDEMLTISITLEQAGFITTSEDNFYEFTKGEISIGMMLDEYIGTVIDFTLPLGNIDSLKEL